MFKLTEENYCFVEIEELAQERKNMGWGENVIPDFVKQAYTSESAREECVKLINEADIVLFENTARKLVIKRLEAGKLTYLYSERYFKSGYDWWKLPFRWYTWHKVFDRYKNHYLLCASAYTAADFALTFNYIGKTYKWGYFPEVKKYNIVDLMSRKLSAKTSGLEEPCVLILWVGRLIKLKHPEIPIYLAKVLKKNGYSFKMNIIGNGEMKQQLQKMIEEFELLDYVEMLGVMTPDKVRMHMENADIFLFTSDFNEGWGAVLNESMNSGCAVVASHAIGAVPYLLKNEENGLIYENGNMEDLIKKVEHLLEDIDFRTRIGRVAYETMAETWNAEVAAIRLLRLSQDLMEKKTSDRFKSGPCSKAGILRNGWFKV